MLKNIGILTSGGDNAGLNAVIRAVTRTGLNRNVNVLGVRRGYRGLIEGQIFPLTSRSVAGTLGNGGTWLGTARLPEWTQPKVRREAIRNMNRANMEGLIVVGGNGSLTGAYNLYQDGFPVIGIPGSIDDDVNGTEVCLGVDTALNIIIEAIDRIRDCASSIQRAFVVEVMGRDCGALALMAASATGAEVCLIPEIDPPPMEKIAEVLTAAYTKGKSHAICVVAEGWKPGASALVKYLQDNQDKTGFDVRPTVLGYTQRGGAPTYRDRYYGSMMGAAACQALLDGETGKMVSIVDGQVKLIPLENVVGKLKPISEQLFTLYRELDV
ncbi:Phosphofructokinase family protein [Tritrichomonas foetus]|uniref:6-phosphofructokinase n=1 Tax=Tritrichomonas foetus TaxID=1144522 RepID=A0A1J4JPQ3_9EUKA|nr:Phosphofructokinase family protein [Tritrichomonas foetus]|eukprot:OHT00392.1 Phosphofructokinase family protein [Tritrichomonas foetus]